MKELNPTSADGMWSWRQHLNKAAMVISTLLPEDTIPAATEFARDLAHPDRAVVLTGVGAAEPLFWHVPAGKEPDTVQPDFVLLLVQNRFTPSTRLLLATADHVILITGSSQEEQAKSLRVMRMIIEKASPSHIEIVVVADGRPAARQAGANLVRMAGSRLADRTSWRHLSARRIRDAARNREEGPMPSRRVRPVPLSEAGLRAREWEESFRRAEKLLEQARAALRRQLAKPGVPVPRVQPRNVEEKRAQAI